MSGESAALTTIPASIRPVAVGRAKPTGLVHWFQASADARENNEFLPAHLEILDTPPSPRGLIFIWVIFALLSSALLWSCFAHLDIYAVATGRIQPNGRSKVVQPFETSKVKEILVTNGAHVKAGMPLIELDATDPNADMSAKRQMLQIIDAQIARRRAAIMSIVAVAAKGKPLYPVGIPPEVQNRETAAMQADINQYFSARDSLQGRIDEKRAAEARITSSIAARERLHVVLQERATMKQTLAAESAGTRAAVLDAMQQVEQAAADLAYDQGQLEETKAAIVSLDKQLAQLKAETLAKQVQALTDSSEKRSSAETDVVKSTLRMERMTLTAPITGTVQQLAVTTVGQVVTAGQPLLVVVPSEGPMEIEALIPNKDIGFIVPGQEVVVKVDAFPFTRYGTIDGIVREVSRDAIDSKEAVASNDATATAQGKSFNPVSGTPQTENLVYPVSIEMKQLSVRSNGKDVPLTPGMTTSVEIRTGSRRVISYLFAPIVETTSTAGHER